MLNNLISNALRYTPEGGTITVQAAFLPGASSLQISVTDTGVLDRAKKGRTDSPLLPGPRDPTLFQAHPRGLGLAIVKQLVEAHGGTSR